MTSDLANELPDIKTQFYALMENYPSVYANYKVNPNLPSAMEQHDKNESGLTSLYRRMFTFQAALEKGLDEQEDGTARLTSEGAQLNAKVARRTSIVNSNNAMMTPANANSSVIEPFVSGLAQLPGCTLDAAGHPQNCPCVLAGETACCSTCGNECPASAIQLSLVSEAKSIEKTLYNYSIARIIYLLTGIMMISYFIFQTVSSPDSTILADAKIKADQLKNNLTEKTESMNANADNALNKYKNNNNNLI